MLDRYLSIKHFRNIGKDSFVDVQLNSVKTNKDKFGGLITFIGENNSGKSNFLDAILRLSDKKTLQSDIPDYDYDDEIKPKIQLTLYDSSSESKYEYKLKNNQIFIDKSIKGKEVEPKEIPKLKFDVLGTLLLKVLSDNRFAQKITSYIHHGREVREIIQKFLETKIISHEDTIIVISFLNQINTNRYSIQLLNQYGTQIHNHHQEGPHQIPMQKQLNEHIPEFINILNGNLGFDTNINQSYEEEVQKLFGIKLIPNIVAYNDKDAYSTKHLRYNFSGERFEINLLFSRLLNFISPKEGDQLSALFKEYYASNRTKNNRLYNKENELNEKLKSVSDAFNQIYTNKTKQKYEFVFDFKDDGILLVIKDNQRAIDLDKQSAGFKWFFNFFINVLSDEKINNGDIVILDEPATNLHPAAQIELVDQLNTFGRDHGILFLMSTHSPFMIDPDYFDQLRIVTRNGLYADVQRFTLNIDSNKDVLLPIKSSLTVDKHVIISPDNKTIYVEGITDYNYLTAFKNTKEKYRHLIFLPINGVKDNKLAQTLINLSKEPIALFDADHAGLKAAEQLEKNKIEVISLNEVNASFIQIEDLFSKEDRALYCFNEDSEKNYKLSSYFKNNFKSIQSKLGKETKENFNLLLDRLIN